MRGVHKAYVIRHSVHPCPVDRRVGFPVSLKQLDLRAISGDNTMAKHALLNGRDGSGGFRSHTTVTELAGDSGFSGVDRVIKRDRLLGCASHSSARSHQKKQDRNDTSATE